MKLALIGWFVGAAILDAQTGIDAGRLYEIQGRVLDADTGAGVPGAKVTLSVIPVSPRAPGRSDPVVFLTDSTGTFRVTNLPAGSATLSCEHRGYVHPPSPPLASVTVALYKERDAASPITLYLRRQGVIKGTALDQNGASLGGTVQAYRLIVVNGHRVPLQAGSGDVDDEGTFRIAGLKAGRYYVALSPSPVRLRSLNLACRRTIYPVSQDLSGAQVISLTWGHDQEVDFHPVLEPAHSVVVKPPPSARNFSVMVRAVHPSGLPEPPTVVYSPNLMDGAVLLTGLPAGEAIISGSWFEGGDQPFRAFKKINVGEGRETEVTLDRSHQNILTISVQGDMPADPSGQTSIELESGAQVFPVILSRNGKTRIGEIAPGVYFLSTSGSVDIQSAYQGGRDALREGVVVPEDGAPEPLTLTFGRSHSGTFAPRLDPACVTDGESVGIAFLRQTPFGFHLESRSFIQNPNELHPFRLNRPGHDPFTPPPGDYIVLAWAGRTDIGQVPYNEPEFLERYGSLIEHTKLGESGTQPVVIHHLLPPDAFEQR